MRKKFYLLSTKKKNTMKRMVLFFFISTNTHIEHWTAPFRVHSSTLSEMIYASDKKEDKKKDVRIKKKRINRIRKNYVEN